MLRFVKKPINTEEFVRPENMDPMIYELLRQRGVGTPEEAEAFLAPSVDGLNDPMLLSNMDTAVEMIRNAVHEGAHICVFGDYDADGVCASAIMTILLREMEADFEVYIPSRHNEGYGLNLNALEELASRTQLLITVDCGISSIAEIERAKELGMQCIVTDHHRPGNVMPDCTIVNPLLNNYPFPWLCGAGVAFKLTHAILGLEAALRVVDIAALATVADIVTLTGENRCIVKLGLDMINRGTRSGIRELIRNAGIEDREIRSNDIAYRLAPRLNAGGRLGSAYRSYELLIADSEFEAISCADALEQANSKRKQLQEEIISEAVMQMQDFDFLKHRIILVRGSGWDHGVIGLAAAHIQKQYNFPTIVFAEKDGLLTGSCRSIPGIDIYQTLSSASELMVRFGGHAQAAGLTIEQENFDLLWERLDSYIRDNCDPLCYYPTEEYDLELPVSCLDTSLLQTIDQLEPFGCGNPRPIFRDRPELIEKRACGAQKNHLQIIASSEGKRVKGICYGEGSRADTPCGKVDILYVPAINIWQGRVSVEMQVMAMQDLDPFNAISAIAFDPNELKCNFLTEIVYNKRYQFGENVPVISKQELKRILGNSIQGVSLVCADVDMAHELAGIFETENPEITIGSFSSDRRGYNSISVCPKDFDMLPVSIHKLIFAGLPIPASVRDDADVFCLEGFEHSEINIPDIDEMRTVYKALRRLAAQPAHFREVFLLDREIAMATGLDIMVCCLSRLALMNMKLITVREKRQIELIVPPPFKIDPDADPVWCTIRKLKTS